MEAYDPATSGAVTRVVLNATNLEVVRANLVLTGTGWNCAGGPSPWGWLSCEELSDDNHGYVFACPTNAQSVQALPIVRIEAVFATPKGTVALP